MTNKCTIISQIITLLHVSTLLYHRQEVCNQYLANTLVFQMQLLVIQFAIKIVLPTAARLLHQQMHIYKIYKIYTLKH